jgi:hypothetical protein
MTKLAEKTIIFMNQLPNDIRQTGMSSFLFVFDNLISPRMVSKLIFNKMRLFSQNSDTLYLNLRIKFNIAYLDLYIS